MLQIEDAEKKINEKLQKLNDLLFSSVTVTQKIKDEIVSGGGLISDKVGNNISGYVDLQKEIYEDIENLINLKKEINSVIIQFDPKYYEILYKRYFKFYTLGEIAKEMNISRQWIYTLHDRALNLVYCSLH